MSGVTCFLHTEKLRTLGPAYETTFRLMVEALVTDTATLSVVMSTTVTEITKPLTKAEILEAAEGLFAIAREDGWYN